MHSYFVMAVAVEMSLSFAAYYCASTMFPSAEKTMNTTSDIPSNELDKIFEGALPQTGELAITPEEATQYRLQLVQYRKMLAQNSDRTRLHTLIVEDQAFSRNLLYQVLNHTCSVSTAANAIDGWKIYVEEVPDIAFLDINMPGANGHVLADRIKFLDPISYVVMVTASQEVADVQVAKNNRVDGFIIKPFSKQKIDDCINRYLATHKKKR